MRDETNFINQLKRGDKDAFHTLFIDYKDLVFNTSLNIVQDESEAMDVLQDVFIEIFQSISSFKGKSSLSTWIYRICVNKSLEVIRKRKRTSVFSLLNLNNKSPEVEKDWVHPGVILENKERAKILYQAISKLKEKERISFTLFHIQGLSQNEISNITNQSLSAIETQIHRAKQKLSQWLVLEKH